MSTAWDLYDSYNALERSASSVKHPAMESTSKASVHSKERDQKLGNTMEKSKIILISGSLKLGFNMRFQIFFWRLQYFISDGTGK